jgi:hypothetical protein
LDDWVPTQTKEVNVKLTHLAVAAALVGLLGFGGAALASAQESPSTTAPSTSEVPSTPDNGQHDPANCPHTDGSSTDSSTDSSTGSSGL